MKNNLKIIKKNTYLVFTLIWIIICLYAFSKNNNANEVILINIFGIFIDQLDLIFILASLIFIFLITIIKNSWNKSKSLFKKLSIFLMILLPLFGYLIFSYFYINNKSEEKHYEFISPSKKYSIVITETSSLMSSSVEFYVRQNLFVIRKQPILFPVFRDLTPIKKNQYRYKWKENTFIFEGKNFLLNDGRWKKVEINLENKNINIKEYIIYPKKYISPKKTKSSK